METRGSELTPESERELVAEMAHLVVEQTAPEELVVFEETAREYFDDPQAVLDPRRRDEAVGFGLDLALLTPYVLAVTTAVVRFLASVLAETVREESKPLLARLIRSLLRRVDDPPRPATETAVPLGAEQARQVRDLAYRRARDLEVSVDTAALLADSLAGSLVVAG